MSIQDNRLQINDIIKNNKLIDKDLLKYFDIQDFKHKFNEFTEILYNDFAFSIDEVLVYYKLNNVRLSRALMFLYFKIFQEVATKYRWYKSNNITYYSNQGKDLVNDNINEAFEQLKGFNVWFRKTYLNNINIIERIKTETIHNHTILNRLYDLGLFKFYNYVVELETLTYDNLFNRRVKQVAQYINKYFFLSEILLKV